MAITSTRKQLVKQTAADLYKYLDLRSPSIDYYHILELINQNIGWVVDLVEEMGPIYEDKIKQRTD